MLPGSYIFVGPVYDQFIGGAKGDPSSVVDLHAGRSSSVLVVLKISPGVRENRAARTTDFSCC